MHMQQHIWLRTSTGMGFGSSTIRLTMNARGPGRRPPGTSGAV